MGGCFSCGQSKDKFKAKICSQIHSAVSPVHITHEASCSNNHHHHHLFNGHLLAPPSPCQNQTANQHHEQGQQENNPSQPHDVMATSFPNMNLTNPIKGLVSKRRNRYKKDGFNLDLTYITDNIIAMGYPASKIESVYRNDIDDVVRFLDQKHKDHYYIYNLCSERSYDKSKFHGRVQIFPFDDHNPPKIESIQPFCNSVHDWLTKDKNNVAVVHCKAGKGRTGTMICCYLLHSDSKKYDCAEKALSFYGSTRTQDKKGVTIPSQVRYVQYYELMLKNRLEYTPVSMYIKEFILNPAPYFASGQGCLNLTISRQAVMHEGMQKCKKLRNDSYELKRGMSPVVIKLDYCLPLTGDIKVEFYNKTKIRKEKLFQFWFNTFFVCDRVSTNGTTTEHNGTGPPEESYQLTLTKKQLDLVNKKDKQHKQFAADFKLTVLLQKIPRNESSRSPYNREGSGPQTDSPSDTSESSDDYNTNEDDDWDSGEGQNLLPRETN